MLEELRITSLGVIEESVLELGPGFTAITGETGAGKTMVVTALGLLLGGRGRLGRRAHRREAARVEGWCRARATGVPRAVDELGGEVEDGRVLLARQISAEGRSRAFAGGAAVPAAALSRSPSRWSPCTASPTSTGCCRPAPSATPWTGSPAKKALALRTAFAARHAALRATEAELAEVVATATRARPGGRPAAVRARGDRGGRHPQPGEDAGAGRRGVPARVRRHAAHRRRAGPGLPLLRGRRTATRSAPSSAARRLLDGVREHDSAGGRRWPTGWPSSATCSPTWPPTCRRTPPSLETDPARLAGGLRAARRAHGADPQVRRDDRRGAGVVGRGRRPGCSTSTTPTSTSSGSRPRCAELRRASWRRSAAALSAQRSRGRRTARRRSSPPS